MVSELEKQRLANIERNQKLLHDFQLQELSNAAFGGAPKSKKPASQRSVKTKREKRSPVPELPRRKSRRLEGVKIEDEYDVAKTQFEQQVKEKEERDRSRKEGEIKLQQVVEEGKWDQALEILGGFGSKLSQGDFFETMPITDKTLAAVRDEFTHLTLDDRDIKLTHERIYSIAFHPSAERPMVLAGDKLGELGIWDASKPEDEGVLNFQTHTRSIATIIVDPNKTNCVYTASYDGSVRKLELPAAKSTEAFVYDSDPRDPVGVSDIALVDSNTLYYTTLQGDFGVADLRGSKQKPAQELHEKKIGGFALNPMNSTQIATASLDRTLKVWDLRYTKAELYGHYDSRLSVSAASWNTAGQIVCNGYDDTVNIFDIPSEKWPKHVEDQDLHPSVRLKHNCQTGRWVSILKARWHERPRDGIQKFAIGNMKRFIDVYSGTGQQIAHLDGYGMSAVPAVVQFHRTENWVVGGTASGKINLFMPQDNETKELKEESKDTQVKEEE